MEKKRKRTRKKTNIGPSNSAGEAIEKMLQEKKISTKINYDVLKSLNANNNLAESKTINTEETPEKYVLFYTNSFIFEFVFVYSNTGED